MSNACLTSLTRRPRVLHRSTGATLFTSISTSLVALLFSAPFATELQAQGTPMPIARVAPRAHWVLTPGVTGTPSQRRDNPGAASEDKLYVFGGRLGNATRTVLNALYEFDGTTWTLKTAESATGSPPKRGGACVAWDWGRNRLIVFGGDDGASPPKFFNDTWEWDPATNKWTQIMTAAAPSARRFSAMSYDPITKGMLLFGGETTVGVRPVGDTWLLLGNTWVRRTSPQSPPARRQHSMVTRRDANEVWLVGGADTVSRPQVRMFDVWRWNGVIWRQVPINNTNPHGTNANQAVYDESRKRIVMQGGQGISVPNTNGGGQYGNLWGGSPSQWCSEFDVLTNRWITYGASAFSTADPVIGRISRYFAGYIPKLGKVYKVSGQNPSGRGTTTGTCEYQATPIASTATRGMGCANLSFAGKAPYELPWLGRQLDTEVTGLASGSIPVALLGFSTLDIPLSAVLPIGRPGCRLLSGFDLVLPLSASNGAATMSLPLPATTSLAGAKFYEQVLVFGLTGSQFTSLESSNALELTAGAL